MQPLRVVLLMLMLPLASPLAAQATQTDSVRRRDLMDLAAAVLGRPVRVTDTLTIENRLTLTLLPSFSVNPATGLALGVSGNGAIRFGPPIITTISTFGLSANYTTKGQLNLLLRTSAYGHGNRMKSEGDWRYLDTNQPTYGLGPAQPGSQKSPMDFQLVRLYETFYLEAVPNILLGVGYHLDWHFGIVDQNAAEGIVTPFLSYNDGATVTQTVSSGLSFNILTDSRDNPINATRGAYAWASLRFFPTWLGSDQSWQSLHADFRVYPQLGKSGRQTLGIWSSMWLSFG